MGLIKRLPYRRWRRVRLVVLSRDGYRCRACGKAGRLEVDHVVPLHSGGAPWELSNLQTLCEKCHWEKTAGENGIDLEARHQWRELLQSLTT